MSKFTVNIVPKGDDKRIPVKLAGQIMVGMQDLLYRIGEYVMSEELRAQGPIDRGLLSKFTLYIDSAGGMGLKATSDRPETRGYGNIVDDALGLLERTMDALGSGIGGYWMDDHYSNPFYRNSVIYDILALDECLRESEGYALVYGSGKTKEFGRPNKEKLSAFIRDRGMTGEGAAIGIMQSIPSKSRKSPVSLSQGKSSVRLRFADPSYDDIVAGPVEVRGMLRYSDDNTILDVSGAKRPEPLVTVAFRRMVSVNGDVELRAPVEASVSYQGDSWMLKNEDLGIVISKPDWDSAVQSFHDYFVFLWVHYTQGAVGDFGDEEKEVRETLMSLVV
ncbi:MAG: hypothetical protein WDA05_00190 [Candidatus Methanomethylophilaceae archaeon]|jgi:hypothetical protein|nr:hypothetical protein AOA81_01195 [Methanomassiliicoccales archaeon RumEn M2]MDD2532116.1 hypothetical protein [Candidatus Methanomethylophilaceae archaeon]MDD4118939.1 hypothetical protein [Candidatus Methanomethylophilaceae archaeon]MDD4454173.1 hypothetical protein [Candidatus Methanomethylophilaceae archaeon]MDI9378999.1 hypothetical protein [Candidatus Thermoplasmatota archaeon]